MTGGIWVPGVLALVAMLLAAAAGAEERERISQATAIRLPELQAELGKVTTREGPLGIVSRQLYVPYPKPDASSVICCDYEGHRGRRRFEVLTYQVFDDVYQDAERRHSDDNGKTWSPWEPCPEVDISTEAGFSWQRFVPVGPSRGCYDRESRRMVQPFSMATFAGDPRKTGLSGTNYHVFARTSRDNGRTWDEPRMIRFEEGPDFDLGRARDPEFMARNYAVFYYNILPLRGGGVIFPADANVTVTGKDGKPEGRSGARCLIGRWDRKAGHYRWESSQPVSLPRELSGYLAEPWLAELKDGRLLLDLRGTNAGATTPNAPGRHWYSLSSDGGKTWSEVADWRYDDGTQFLSPATMGKVLRHSRTRKLYWFGNISAGPTQGNSPRYPLYIAEIDERRPAIKGSTLTVIDTYDPQRHTPAVQFSNFWVFENRDTHEFELYLSPYGQYANVYQASVYKYTLRLK